jgi:hypothetical protein
MLQDESRSIPINLSDGRRKKALSPVDEHRKCTIIGKPLRRDAGSGSAAIVSTDGR